MVDTRNSGFVRDGNTAGIIGFGEAVKILRERWRQDKDRIEKLSDRLKAGFEKR